MSLSTLMTRFGGMDANEPPFRLAILTESGANRSCNRATMAALSTIVRAVDRMVDLRVYCIGSCPPGGPSFGVQYVSPIGASGGARWNSAMKTIQTSDAEAVFMLGADSIVDQNTIVTYATYMRSYFRCLASFDQYFINETGEKLVFWEGYKGDRQGLTTLSGRCLHRDWLDQVDWILWETETNDLELGMQAKMDGLKSYAAHAGEHRIFGCIAHDFALLTVREDRDGFFDQDGDSAQTQRRDREAFFERFYDDVDATSFTGHEIDKVSTVDKAESSFPDVSTPEPSTPSATNSTNSAKTDIQSGGLQLPSLAAAQNGGGGLTLKSSLSKAVSAVAKSLDVDLPQPSQTQLIDQTQSNSAQMTQKTEPELAKASLTTATESMAQEVPKQEPTTQPQSVDDWISQGEAAFANGDIPNAQKCFESALALDPLSATALNDLAVAHHTQGHLEEAERCYLQAVAFDPKGADPFVGLVSLALEAQQPGLAIKYIARGLKRDPGHEQLILRGQELANAYGQGAGAQEVHS